MYPEKEVKTLFAVDRYNNLVIQSQKLFISANGTTTYTLTARAQKLVRMIVSQFYHHGYISTNLCHFLDIHTGHMYGVMLDYIS